MDMGGEVKIPAIGPVNKKVLFGVGGAAAAFIGYSYYRARQNAAASASTDPTDPGYVDPGVLPSVAGAVPADNSYGSGGAAAPSTDDYGFHGTTNSEWTQYTSTQLMQSDRWSYTDILQALGNYLAGKPLATLDQQIVQAAIAVGGPPPVGTHVVVSGGNTKITVAPTGLKVVSTTSTTATVSFTEVAGAGYYRGYHSDVPGNANVASSDRSPIVFSGLQPNKSYSFQVAADSTSDVPGPKSASVTGKTKAISLARPSTPHLVSAGVSSVKVSTGTVKGAQYYRWYVNGVAHGSSDTPVYTITGLKKATSYKVTVAADTTTNSPGPVSAAVSVKTKAK